MNLNYGGYLDEGMDMLSSYVMEGETKWELRNKSRSWPLDVLAERELERRLEEDAESIYNGSNETLKEIYCD